MSNRKLNDVQTFELIAYLKGLANEDNHIPLNPSKIAEGAESIIGMKVSNASILRRCKKFDITLERERVSGTNRQINILMDEIVALEVRVAALELGFDLIQAVEVPAK